ncbi:sensor histidine kinase [Cellulomonas rhizosphaerae]|uniref:histidine kinase n=1 Tax=Cellulomonas rhizosphaerae TaxID=2293719 RepID=A0A413RLP6_9CELL|nr:histidine kinase [Cellulomonas rhizosphaerae]RHA41016.1 hypothetical protein D1825_09275 [Cellulomonas rhizosphaerae]
MDRLAGDDRRTGAVIAIATAVFGVGIVVIRADADQLGRPVAVEVVAQVVGAVLLGVLWRWPLWAYVACVALSVYSPVLAACVCAFLVGRRLRQTREVVAVVLGAQGLLVLGWVVSARPWQPGHLAAMVTLTLVAWILGGAARSAADAAETRATAEAARRVHLAETVRAAEQDRLAREMHDVVAHRISLIVLNANRIESGSAADVVEVAGQIRQTGRAALDDMRQVLGRLRHDEAAPGLARLAFDEVDGLVAEMREVGQPIAVRIVAEGRTPPDAAERTAVLVVREALTNAVRHAPGADTSIEIADGPGAVRVRVTNGRPSGTVDHEMTTGGHGLLGLKERVAMLAGTWNAAATPEGGFVVEATLPRADQ